MAKNGLVHGPSKPIASMPASYKGSHKGTYNGVQVGPAGQYKRTGGLVPERTFDDQSVTVDKK